MGCVMLDKIRSILAEQLSLNPDEVTEESNFKEDLGVDSLDLFELLMSLEEEYGFEIPAEDLEGLQTVGDLIEYLQKNEIG